jgi:7-cyano-7-deazaguanine synthase
MDGGETLVLLSGGIDSATSLALAIGRTAPVTTLFVDYGQSAAMAEARSSSAIARHYGVPIRGLTLRGPRFGGGEIKGRNAFLLHVALLTLESEAGVVVIAVHNGTPYRDCSQPFLELMQLSFDFHTGGAVMLAAPFADKRKNEVFDLAIELGVPVELTHSCEVGDVPCNRCLSCLDREALFAGA